MAWFGKKTSFYVQKELLELMDKAISENSHFKSRSHFVNCAIARELRRLENG